MTYREAVYLITDSLKIFSDDSIWETDHIIKFIHKYRSMLVKQRLLDRKKEIPAVFYQRLRVKFNTNSAGSGIYKSEKLIPTPIDNQIINTYRYVSLNGISSINFNFISPSRFKFIGYNKWLKNEVYVCIDLDGYMYIKDPSTSSLVSQLVGLNVLNDTYIAQDELSEYQFVFNQDFDLYLEYDTILDNPIEADMFNGTNTLDVLDLDLPCDEALFQSVVDMTVKEIAALNGLPRDFNNNANDDTGVVQNSNKQ